MKKSKTEDTGLLRKAPDHVAVVFSGYEKSAAPHGAVGQRELETFPKNIIETAVQFGVRFLTFCCPDKYESDEESSVSLDQKRLFQLLLLDGNWLESNNIAVRFIENNGQRKMPDKSKINISMIPQIDGRSEILRSIQSIAKKIERGEMGANDIASSMIGEQIGPLDLPDPDLLIFTGGLKRLGNSFIWQSAYSEFAFVDEPWQSVTTERFQGILDDYMGRDRRFGGLTVKPVTSSQKAG